MRHAIDCLAFLSCGLAGVAAQPPAKSLPRQTTIDAAGGPIVVSPFMHASVQIEHGGRVIQIDPAMGDQSAAKPADLVVVTDVHEDHLNPSRIGRLRKTGAPPERATVRWLELVDSAASLVCAACHPASWISAGVSRAAVTTSPTARTTAAGSDRRIGGSVPRY